MTVHSWLVSSLVRRDLLGFPGLFGNKTTWPILTEGRFCETTQEQDVPAREDKQNGNTA